MEQRLRLVQGVVMTERKDKRRPPGPPKYQPSTEEQARIVTMAASGASENRISKSIKRSRKMVHDVLAKPETQAEVSIEKAKLAEIYKQKARDIVVSINDEDISKASLQQKAVSSGILLDKSLLLSGEPTEILAANVGVLMDVVEAIKAIEDKNRVRYTAEFRKATGLHHLPTVIEAVPTAEPVASQNRHSIEQPEPGIRYYPVPLNAPGENG